MKRFLSLLAGAVVALAALSTPAYAAVSAPLVINWTNPTTGCTTINGVAVNPCDNIPLTGGDALSALDLFISTTGTPDCQSAPTLTVTAPNTTASTTVAINSGQTVHIRVQARIASGGKSFCSNEVTKTFTTGVLPGSPTNVTITLVIS